MTVSAKMCIWLPMSNRMLPQPTNVEGFGSKLPKHNSNETQFPEAGNRLLKYLLPNLVQIPVEHNLTVFN